MNPYLMIFERKMTPIRKLLLMHLAAGGKLTEYTETGNPVSFNTNVAKPLSVLAAFSPVQAGSGDPSPENIRSISGFSSANVYLSPTDSDDPAKQTFAVTFPALGKNLFDKNAVKDGYIWWEGGNSTSSADGNASEKIPVIPGEIYTLYRSNISQNQVEYFDADGIYLAQDVTHWGTQIATNVIPDGVYFIAFNVFDSALDTAMFIKGNIVGAYEPYRNTAYGGTYNPTTGVLSLGWLYFCLTNEIPLYAGGASYNGQTGTNRFAYLSNVISAFTAGGYSDMMKRVNRATWDNPDNDLWHYYINAGNQLHMVFENETVGITSEMSASDRTAAIKTWLADNPVTFVLPLATPIEYQLSGTEILSLIGNNVLWSDLNGDLNVTYKKKG